LNYPVFDVPRFLSVRLVTICIPNYNPSWHRGNYFICMQGRDWVVYLIYDFALAPFLFLCNTGWRWGGGEDQASRLDCVDLYDNMGNANAAKFADCKRSECEDSQNLRYVQ